MTNADGILPEIVEMLVEVVGDDFPLPAPVGPDTMLNGDLALESIEFAVLAEMLRARYGDRADFAAFVAGLDLDQVMTMTAGDLARYVEERLRPAAV